MYYLLDILLVYLLIFTITIFIYGLGSYIEKKFDLKNECISESIITGLFFIASITLLLNFFLKISFLLNLLILTIGIYLFFLDKENYNSKKIIHLVYISLIGLITILFSNINMPDGANYHLPYINIINKSNLIIGLNNINLRYGQTSILQYLSAVLNYKFYENQIIIFPSLLIYSSLIFFFFKKFLTLNNKFLKLTVAFILIIFLADMNRFNEFGNDEPAHMIFLYINYLIIENFIENNNQYKRNIYRKIFFLSLFLFTIKIIYALFIFIIIYLFSIAKDKKKIIFDKFNCILLLIFFLWILKNFFISSCFVYPISFTCFNTEWNNYGYLSENILTEAWSKGYPDQAIKKDYISYINNFFLWFPIWAKNHFFVTIFKKIILVISLFFLCGICVKFKKIEQKEKDIISLLNNLIYIYAVCVIIWLLYFPVYRFGSGFILIIIALFMLRYFNKFDFEINYSRLKLLIIILTIIILNKNLLRIYKNINFEDYKYYLFISYPNIKNLDNSSLKKHHSNFFYSSHPNHCFITNEICTSWDINDLGSIKIEYGKYFTKIYSFNEKNWWKKKFNTF